MRPVSVPVMLLLLACGSENDLKDFDPPALAGDTSEPPAEEEIEPPPPPPEECPERIWSGQMMSIDEECFISPSEATFDPIIEWSMSTFTEYPFAINSFNSPIVGNLTDDNNDGVLDSLDTPDIVTIQNDDPTRNWCSAGTEAGVLRLISGDGSEVFWSQRDFEYDGETWYANPGVTPAIADVDSDGEPEILFTIYQGKNINTARLVSIDSFGNVEWISTDSVNMDLGQPSGVPAGAISVGDLDQDGIGEVFLGDLVINGEDGSLHTTLGEYSGKSWITFMMDLEKDGFHEVVTDFGIFEQDGTQRCDFFFPQGFVAIADINMDGTGEIVLTGNRFVSLYDNYCRLLDFWPTMDGGRAGAATIADYDGDGQPEIGIASAIEYYVYETDGTWLWSHEVQDVSSNFTGSTVFDFEGDGYSEVVYAGEVNLWIFSGQEGNARMIEESHTSCTGVEYPTIVDVDNDAQVEVVVADYNGIRVVGDLNESWVSARPVWNQHAYSITNINDDLSLPMYSESNWPEYNSFHSGDIRLNNGEGANLIDLQPIVADICEVECDRETVKVAIQTGNAGLRDASGQLDVKFYTEIDGVLNEVITVSEEVLIRSGTSLGGAQYTFDMASLPESNLIISVDDNGIEGGVFEECDEENNQIRIDELCVEDD